MLLITLITSLMHQLQLARFHLGNKDYIIDEAGQPSVFLQTRCDDLAQFLRAPLPTQGDFRLTLENGERSTQFVGQFATDSYMRPNESCSRSAFRSKRPPGYSTRQASPRRRVARRGWSG